MEGRGRRLGVGSYALKLTYNSVLGKSPVDGIIGNMNGRVYAPDLLVLQVLRWLLQPWPWVPAIQDKPWAQWID